jgi:sec-independent protein translocase protein TatC
VSALRAVGHDERLSIVEHLDELRARLILCIAVFVAAFGLTYWQSDHILDAVNRPLDRAQRADCDTAAKADDTLRRPPAHPAVPVVAGLWLPPSGLHYG